MTLAFILTIPTSLSSTDFGYKNLLNQVYIKFDYIFNAKFFERALKQLSPTFELILCLGIPSTCIKLDWIEKSYRYFVHVVIWLIDVLHVKPLSHHFNKTYLTSRLLTSSLTTTMMRGKGRPRPYTAGCTSPRVRVKGRPSLRITISQAKKTHCNNNLQIPKEIASTWRSILWHQCKVLIFPSLVKFEEFSFLYSYLPAF